MTIPKAGLSLIGRAAESAKANMYGANTRSLYSANQTLIPRFQISGLHTKALFVPSRPRSLSAPYRSSQSLRSALNADAIQIRSKCTAVPAPSKPIHIDGIYDYLKSAELKQHTKDAECIGFHGTSNVNAEGIIRDGFDTSRNGENFSGYSAAGEGLYTAKSAYQVINYAQIAAKNAMREGVRPDGLEPKGQVLAIFRRSKVPVVMHGLAEVRSDPDKEKVVHEIGDGALAGNQGEYLVNIVRPKALEHPEIEYLVVPLPPFKITSSSFFQDECSTVTMELNKFISESFPEAKLIP